MSTVNPFIEIVGVRKSFDDNEVLKGIDLSIAKGEVIALIGKSGSGKSTLLRCINGLETHNAGTIHVDGKEVRANDNAAIRELRQSVGMIFQNFNLFPHLTAAKNIMLAPMRVKKTAPQVLEAQARTLLERVGLSEKFDAFPDQLSGGQQQRIAIARALAMAPQVLLCDEITSALDPELVGEVLRVVESLAKEGMTLLMVTHEMGFAKRVANRVIFMHAGRIHEHGTPAQIFSAPQTPELQQFLSGLGD
jgi:polar amino acid transport system ATP-binding protein